MRCASNGTNGNALQRMRVARGLSPTSVARQLGITYAALWKMENGARRTVSGKRAIQLSEIYGVPVEQIIKELITEADHPQQTA